MKIAPPARGLDPHLQIALDANTSIGNHLTGVGIYSRELITGLAAGHPQVDWRLCYRWPAVRKAFRAPRIPHTHLCWLQRAWQLGGLSRKALFHGLNQRLPQNWQGRRVVTFHDLFVLTGEYSTPDFRERFALQARQAAEHADLAIAVSNFTARALEDLLHLERSRIRVIPHGYRFRPAARTSPEPRRERLILNVGAIQKRKNIARLVRAFERLDAPEWRLVLAGSSTGYGAQQELQAVEASPARARISVLGYVADEELADLFSRASIFAFPSLDEGFGIPVLEAMAARVPVLTSRRSALTEVAGDAALLVDPEQQEELDLALRRLAADEKLRRDLAVRGDARVRLFTWERAVEKTWSVYCELT